MRLVQRYPEGVTTRPGPGVTANRSILGCMNDQAFTIEVGTEHRGDLDLVDAASVNDRLRRHIHLTMDGYAIDRARARLTVT